MAQFEFSGTAVRDHIRRLLHDSYRGGFPILKELVQNADDAGARTLVIVEAPNGAGGVGHPLLDGPALLAVNDAEFDGRNERGIKSLGDSSKASDGSKIGRFGLGMKAVFHLCDAFAWLASPQPLSDRPRRRALDDAELINPWAEVTSHLDWTEPTREQWSAARAVAGAIAATEFGAASAWFCLWIPQRTPALVADGRASFANAGCEALQEMLGIAGARQLATAMPVLRKLRRVRVGHANTRYELAVDTPDGLGEADARPLDTRVTLTTAKGRKTFRAIGSVAKCEALAAEFRAHDHWPKQENATGHVVPNPARAGGAAYWVADIDDYNVNAADGCVRVQPAVYLPLGDDAPAASDRNASLVIHGEFFVDAGRRGLVLDGSRQTAVEADWNRALLERLLLPEVPGTLFQLAGSIASSQQRDRFITNMVKGLRSAADIAGNGRFFDSWRRAIGRHRQLVFRLGTNGGWQLVAVDADAYAIDASWGGQHDRLAAEATSARLRDALPGFDAVSSAAVLVPLRSLSLAAEEASDLTSEVAARLLGEPDELATRFGADTWRPITSVLHIVARDANQVDSLLGYARALLGAWSARAREARDVERDALRAALDLVPSDRVIPVPDELPPAVLRYDVGYLLLPDALAGEAGEHHGLLPAADVATLLRRTIAEKASPTTLSRLARRLVSFAEGDLAGLEELHVFRAVIEGKGKLVSLRELRDAANADILFRGGIAIKALSASTGTIVLDCDDVPDVEGLRDVGSCDVAAACAVLDRLQTISPSPPKRRPLLELLLRLGVKESTRSAIRILLAGEVVAPGDVLLTATGEAAVWSDLLLAADVASDQQSAIVDGSLTALLNPEQCRALNVVPINATAVLSRLSRLGDAQLSTLVLSPAQAEAAYDHLLDAVDRCETTDHDRVARLLPVHLAIGGERVTCDNDTFVDVGIDLCDVPDALRRRLRLLRPHAHEKRRRAQRQLVRDLDATSLLAALFDHERRAPMVTASAELFLTLIEGSREDLPNGLERLAWLPTPLGRRGPADVLRLPFSARHWTARAQDPEVSEADLDADIQKRLSRLRPRPLQPEREQSLQRLAKAAATCDELRIGIGLYAEEAGDVSLDAWRRAFANEGSVMPAAGLLREVVDARWPGGVDGGSLLQTILKPLAAPIADAERLVAILDHLARRHGEAAEVERMPIERLFAKYLGAAVAHEAWAQILPRLRLLSEEGSWVIASQLCTGTPGVSPRHLLAEWLVLQLKPHVQGTLSEPADVPATVQVPAGLDPSGAAALLRTYVDALPAPPAVIGAFVMLLGDDPDLRALAEERLGSRTIGGTRALVKPWPVDPTSNSVSYRLTLDKACQLARVAVTVSDAKTIDVTNLCGNPAQFPASDQPKSLVVGVPSRFKPIAGPLAGTPCLHLRLRRLNNIPLEAKDATELLRVTAVDVINYVHWRWNGIDLRELWSELTEADQLDVETAAEMVLEQVDAHLERLSKERLGMFRPKLRAIRTAVERRVEARHNRNDDRVANAKQDEAAARAEVAKMISDDAAAQQEVLAALRSKIAENGYEPESVPLELFQNADDAAVEFAQMIAASGVADELPVSELFAAAASEGGTLRFAHWGRPVNKYRHGRFDGRDRGFGSDLRKMLSLSESDKLVDGMIDGTAVRATTGRFGLGFKSVFLIADAPKAVSGWLAFEVRGGLLPVSLADGEPQRLRKEAARLWTAATGAADAPPGATLFELTPRTDANVRESKPLAELARLAPALVIFAKRLRHLHVESGDSYDAIWRPTFIHGVDGLEVGPLSAPAQRKVLKVGDRSIDPLPSRAMFFGGSNREGVLIGLSPEGPTRFDGLPDVWVTMPTGRSAGAGVAVNGPFDVDPGRTQLRTSGETTDTSVARIAATFGRQLVALFDVATGDWNAARATLGIRQDVSAASFLGKLFEISTPAFSAEESPEARVLRGSLSGIATLIRERPALPADFASDPPLRRLADVNAVVVGALARLPRLREAVIGWTCWSTLTGERFVVETVRDRLRRIGVTLPHVAEVGLREAVDAELHHGAGPVEAARVGRFLLPLLAPSADSERTLDDNESPAIDAALRSKRFRGEDGSWHEPAELLLPAGATDAGDERMRAAFAPPGSSLSDEYDADGVALFRRARESMPSRMGPKAMVEWAFAATVIDVRIGVLRYLASGQHARELGLLLSDDKRFATATWLSGLTVRDQLLRAAVVDKHGQYQVMLHLRRQLPAELDDHFVATPVGKEGESPLLRMKPREFLQRLHALWMPHASRLTAEYERRIYGGTPRPVDLDRLDRGDDREALFELFMLGALHATPFGRPERWRNFVSCCRERGWLDTFAAPAIDADAWMAVLDEYVRHEGDNSYKLEMARFPQIYQLARHLDEYALALSEVAKSNRLSPCDLFDTRGSALLSGTGIGDVPALWRAAGQKGQHFIARELVRRRLLVSPAFAPYCFVPVQRVRRLVEDWGGEGGTSTGIHEWLIRHLGKEDATFGGAFDLPLLAAADGTVNVLDDAARIYLDDDERVAALGEFT